uniref:Armadillo-like helical domain-containing protein 4 n=1 Tax=Oryzias latipes TaxID=8090 RepID=A0A3P9H633_ORYLA
MSGKLQLLLLCGSCLCLRGAPNQLVTLTGTTHGASASSNAGRVSSLPTNVGSGGETALHGDHLMETENWDTLGTLENEKDVRDAQSQRNKMETGDVARENEAVGIDGLPPEPMGTPEVATRRLLTLASLQLERQKRNQSTTQGFIQSENQETSSPSSTDSAHFWTQKQTSFSASQAAMSDAPQAVTHLPGCDGAADPLSDEVGPDLMCRQEGRRAGTAAPAAASKKVDFLPQDGSTEARSSPVALPIKPFKVQRLAAAQRIHGMGFRQPPDAMATTGLLLSKVTLDRLVTGQTDSDKSSQGRSSLLPDQIPPRQTSVEDPEPVSSSSPYLLHVKVKLEHQHETEEQDEDENSEESEEEDSEEDLTERFTESAYGHIPPPPLWVQGNQGLMRSWLDLIKEKAGHVSGMLIPVGIGITGALMISGVLYSISMVYRRRRDNFKELRRIVRQPEHLHEDGSSVQDQAMLLVNSSEDEF